MRKQRVAGRKQQAAGSGQAKTDTETWRRGETANEGDGDAETI